MKTLPETGVLDIFRLAGSFVGAFLRHPLAFDSGSVLTNWMKDLTVRYNSENVILNFFVKKLLLVFGRDLSTHILQGRPSSKGYIEGPLKRKAMSFLAPQALTISHDDKWERLRAFNEKVLCTGQPHNHQQAFLDQLRRAFSTPVSSIADIRKCMGRTMLGIVFGDNIAPEHLSEDIQVLFGLVQSPVKRIVSGTRKKARLEKFYSSLRMIWREAGESEIPSLLSLAHRFSQGKNAAELIQQVPHWMFTFTGSGTDLLVRTLALVSSRPAVRARVLSEIAEKGPLDQASVITQLEYLEACLMESARLFPPVTRTFHCAPAGDVFDNIFIPPGMEIMHFFLLTQRDSSFDPSAHLFQPERWLDPADNAHSAYPNLFLSGARACPGKDLILFVSKSALAILLGPHNLKTECAPLSGDPLPVSFPEKEIRFQVRGNNDPFAKFPDQ
jgi:cytochrome P450